MRQPISPPTGTVTFLFTDIEGSTKLWESSPDAMRDALACHDEIVRASIEANGGTVFKTMGDAFCAAFHTAPEAVAAALDAQQSLSTEPWEIEPPVRSRMALHTGAAEERDGDYLGQPLNRVARLLSAGYGGQVLVSAAAHELVRDALPAGCSLRDLGDANLKDLARPERVYQLDHPSLQGEFPPLRTLNSGQLPNNLPQQPTSFIGREKELADVKSLLLKTRLLTLVGAGGAGKTRLALQAAADLLDGEGDGVWLVELAPLTDAALVPSAIAQAVGIKETPGKPIEAALLDALKSKTMLVMLDNCEHVVQACAHIAADLLRSCPGVHILATSREPLGIAGEQVFRIPSLSAPDRAGLEGAAVTADSLSHYESVQLFIERAKAVQPAFAVTDQNAPAVAQVCYHLDGIPLAIELAAARVRSMPVDQVNARLESRFRLLTGGSRAALPRQQTLRALIDWSYDLLSEPEKAILARLSVFAGGWTLDAAEAVCSGDGIKDWQTLDLLTSLTDKSLIVYDEGIASDNSGGVRYRMLETIREYGQERLGAAGDALATARRHRDWFLLLAKEAEPHLAGQDAALWLARLELEYDNMRAALRYCEQEPGADAAFAGLELAGALWMFWDIRGHWSEGSRRIERALEHAEDATLEMPEVLPLKAKAIYVKGLLAFKRGDSAAAHVQLQRSLDLHRDLHDRFGAAMSLNALGHIDYTKGDYPAARGLYLEALQLRREAGDEFGVAGSLMNLGNVARDQGDYDAARTLFEESLAIRRRIGDQPGLAGTLSNLGYTAWGVGDFSTARALQQESLDIRRALGDQLGIALSLNGLGVVAVDERDFDLARACFQESLDIKRRIGDQSGVALALTNLGMVAHQQGDYAAARVLLREGLAMINLLGSPLGVSEVLECIGDTAFEQGSPERAVQYWGAAAALRKQIGVTLEPKQQGVYEEKLDEARHLLGSDSAYNDAWASGEAMTQDQAVEYALSESG